MAVVVKISPKSAIASNKTYQKAIAKSLNCLVYDNVSVGFIKGVTNQ
ncbi:hypothetical protein VB774_16000 [Pseudanabaena galeata UHCC 0370]|uniref:Uncharacterized protein n=1 Tax=Pseudanabaena galeata UHCC 0370 TaxID=3110310 RepID=A0ABU5TLB4_9CYAN|nr:MULTISPECIES: hypothetical protein [Pseudanabaena]MEA5479125.1 hypothetical protein [Pseudanabaena galeata UHCC 0370]MEA5488294.1 hypothetical protein [Pseudanabaena sp. CCNP1317]WGS72880.1 hypothetical protein OA858_02305 [Pseudanabaena galeata CCNP1313]